MKRMIAAALICLLALTLPACSCGRQEPDLMAERAGVYELTAIVRDGSETAPEDIDLVNGIGLTSTMRLEADGSGTLDLFGEEKELSWNEETITVGGRSYSYTYKEKEITVGKEESSLTFRRNE